MNGFFSVIGSVLTTILSMTFGFRVVMLLALGAYVIALLALHLLLRATDIADGPETEVGRGDRTTPAVPVGSPAA